MRLALFFSVLLLTLVGCSSVKLMYNQLDWLIPWYLDDYITLDSAQSALLEQRLKTQLHWHRTTQLPDYANRLRQINQSLQNGLARTELIQYSEQIDAYRTTLLRELIPDFVDLLATVTDAQVAELLTNLENKNQEYQAEYVDLPIKELREMRTDRARKHLQRWLGDITPAQERILRDWSQDFASVGGARLAYRRQWQQQLQQLLAQRNDKAYLAESLEKLISYPEEYGLVRERNRQLVIDLLLKIDQSMTSGQRVHLSKKITELADDFDALAKAAD